MPDPLGNLSFIWPLYAAFLAGYLIGSIPFGMLFTKSAGLGDIRNIGSGNIGATNVLRTGSRKLAALTLCFDILKGAVPVIVVDQLIFRDHALLTGAGAIFGHLLPIWLISSAKYSRVFVLRALRLAAVGITLLLLSKGIVSILGGLVLIVTSTFAWGGKGVATGLGVLLAINPMVGAFACAVWLTIALITQYSSLAALIAFFSAPVLCFALSHIDINAKFLANPQETEFAGFLAILIWVRHADNIRRLLRGDEPKIQKTSKLEQKSG